MLQWMDASVVLPISRCGRLPSLGSPLGTAPGALAALVGAPCLLPSFFTWAECCSLCWWAVAGAVAHAECVQTHGVVLPCVAAGSVCFAPASALLDSLLLFHHLTCLTVPCLPHPAFVGACGFKCRLAH